MDFSDLYYVEQLPNLRGYIKREVEINKHALIIKNHAITAIHGEPGTGKTIIAAFVVKRFKRPSLYVNLQKGVNDNFETIIKIIASFLNKNEHPDLWSLIVENEEKKHFAYNMESKIEAVIQSLTNFPCCIVFDNLEILQRDSKVFTLINSIIGATTNNHKIIIVILLSQGMPALNIPQPSSPTLGFTKEEACKYLEGQAIILEKRLFEKLFTTTRGYPIYFVLFMNWYKKEPHTGKEILTFINNWYKDLDSSKYIYECYFQTFKEDQQEVLKIISILHEPIDLEDLKEILDAVENQTLSVPETINDLRFMGAIELSETNNAISYVQGLHRQYIASIATPRVRKILWVIAADYYRRKENYLQAATYLFWLKQPNEAIELLIKHAQEIMNKGHTDELEKLLSMLQSEA